MYRPFLWCLLGIVIGGSTYLAIDKFGTPRAVPAASAPQGLSVPLAPAAGRGPSLEPPAAPPAAPPAPARFSADVLSGGGPRSAPDAPTGGRGNASPGGMPTGAASGPDGSRAAGRARLEQLRAIQSDLQKLISRPGGMNISDLDAVMGRLEAVQDEDGRIGGVPLDTLRGNLERAGRMMEISQNINAAVERGAPPEELRQYIHEIQGLQDLPPAMLPSADSRGALDGQGEVAR